MNGIAMGLTMMLAMTGVADHEHFGPQWAEQSSVKVHLKWVEVQDGVRSVWQSRHVPVTTNIPVQVTSVDDFNQTCKWNFKLTPQRGRVEVDLSAKLDAYIYIVLGAEIPKSSFKKQAQVRPGQVNRWVIHQNKEGIPTSWVEFTVVETQRFDPSEAAEPQQPAGAEPTSTQGLPTYYEPF